MVKQNRTADADPLTFADLARSPAAHLKALRASCEGLDITYKGKRAAVMLAPETYRKLQADAEEMELRRSLDRSFDQIERGEGRPAKEFIAELRAKLAAKAKGKSKRATSRRGR